MMAQWNFSRKERRLGGHSVCQVGRCRIARIVVNIIVAIGLARVHLDPVIRKYMGEIQ